MLKKLIKFSLYSGFLLISTLLLFELSYRWYLVDFYSSNFRLLNPSLKDNLKEDQPKILAIGDSFTADPNSYVKLLKDSLPAWNIINASVPGTCVKQHSLYGGRRIQKIKPDILIYQLYTGNDLFEFKHRFKEGHTNLIRKIYWKLSDRIWSIAYVNSRFPAIRRALSQEIDQQQDPKLSEDFSSANYSGRVKLQLKTEPFLIENSILLKGKRDLDLKRYVRKLDRILKKAPSGTPIFLLIMPHCAQVNKVYFERMQQLGASFSVSGLNAGNFNFKSELKRYFAEDSRVHILDPTSFLAEADSVSQVYFSNDPHLNPFGQATVGSMLLKRIFEKTGDSNEFE